MLECLVIFSLAGIFYSYFGYPILLVLIRSVRGRRVVTGQEKSSQKSVTIIIAARNEEQVIEEKINNTLSLRVPQDVDVQILVASDCSDDATDSIAQSFASRGVLLVRNNVRQGKEAVQGLALQEARGEIVIFTDAKSALLPDAIEKFLPYFSDPTIGAVSSTDKVEGSSGEGLYVRYEMWLRKLESSFQSVVGLSGSCFAVRKSVCAPWQNDIPSDFALLLNAARLQVRGVLAPDVLCTYKAAQSADAEFSRKVRTVLRGIATVFARKEVFNFFRFGWFSFQIASHKLCRWLVPWFFVLGFVGSLLMAGQADIYMLLVIAYALFVLFAALGREYETLSHHALFKLPLFFLISNYAIAVAWVRYFQGERALHWTPTTR